AGNQRLSAVLTAPGSSEGEHLGLAASLERASEHPLAAAIVDGARGRGLASQDVVDFESATGAGVAGSVDGRRVALGNLQWMQRNGIIRPEGPEPSPDIGLLQRADAL